MQIGFIFSLVFSAIIGLFAMRNGHKVTIDLFFTELYMSQAIVIIGSALLGALVVFILSFFKTIHFKREIKEINKKNVAADGEITQLNDRLLIATEEKKGLLKLIDEKQDQINTLVDINTELPSKDNN